MNGLEELKVNIKELIRKHKGLKEENNILLEKVERINKDKKFLERKNKEYPEVIQKNRKLVEERKKIAKKVDDILRRIDKAGKT